MLGVACRLGRTPLPLQTTSPPPSPASSPSWHSAGPFPICCTFGSSLFPREGGRTRCHGDVSLPTPRPAREARSFPAQPRPASLARGGHGGPALPCGRRVLGSRFFGLEGKRGHSLRTQGERDGEGRNRDEKFSIQAPWPLCPFLPPTGTPQSNAVSLVPEHLGGDVGRSAFLSTSSRNPGAFFKVSGT